MNEKSWLEVSLTVDGELAEAVSEVLARFAPDGVAIESTAVTAALDDSQGHAVGPLRVCAYLPVDSDLEGKRNQLEEALWFLGRIRPLPDVQYRTVQQANWAETWKQHYHPITIGRRLVVVPAWLESPDPARIPVRVDPGMAFGTGTHPTTQLCLELLEDSIQAPLDVIDVGCGSGILSIAALKLGARHALGVDLDPEAITATQENAALNGVSNELEIGLGSVAEIRMGKYTLCTGQLVVANILAPVIVNLLGGGLGDLLSPAGKLILSGILAEQSIGVETALSECGLELVDKRQQGDWVALAAQNP